MGQVSVERFVNNDQCDILKHFNTLDVSMANLTKFLLTLLAVASNNSNHAVNSINSRNKSSPGKTKTMALRIFCPELLTLQLL